MKNISKLSLIVTLFMIFSYQPVFSFPSTTVGGTLPHSGGKGWYVDRIVSGPQKGKYVYGTQTGDGRTSRGMASDSKDAEKLARQAHKAEKKAEKKAKKLEKLEKRKNKNKNGVMIGPDGRADFGDDKDLPGTPNRPPRN